MIPKIIHYCWFGRTEKPESVKAYIDTWRTVMPDYEIREWNEDNFDIGYCAFTREAYAFRNYAFVADVCRLKVLYEYGGIYFDTDIEVLKPFDDYLHHHSFCGYEDRWIGTGVMGAEAGCKWIGVFLDFYKRRHFVNIFGHTVRTANTQLLTLKIMPLLKEEDKPVIYPIDYFCAKSWNTKEVKVTCNTVSIHHYACTWARKKKTLPMRIRLLAKGLRVRYLGSPYRGDGIVSGSDVSLIISTYNRPEALRICLDSVFRQTVMPKEVVIGDDGSTQETALLIEEMRRRSPVPLIHVWHEDRGFRLAMMRNKSVAHTTGSYIIEIDGDVFMHPSFVSDHIKGARRGCYLKGGRTNLGLALTEKVISLGHAVDIHWWTRGIESKPENAIHCRKVAELIAPYYRRHRSMALGCNMSFFKDDFIRVNGYDEYYEGWGGEDGDFGCRLNMIGLKKRSLKFAGIVFHLWHEDKYMYNKDKNISYSLQCKERNEAYCRNGYDKYVNG